MQIADLGNFLDEEQRTFNDYIYNKPKYFFFCKLLITFFFWGLLMEGLTWTVALEKYRLQQAEEIEKKYELAQIVNKKLTKGIGRYKLVQEHNVRAISACAEVAGKRPGDVQIDSINIDGKQILLKGKGVRPSSITNYSLNLPGGEYGQVHVNSIDQNEDVASFEVSMEKTKKPAPTEHKEGAEKEAGNNA